MNKYRIYLTGDEASTWRRLVSRYYWLPDSQIITHLVEVHGLSCKDHCSLDRLKNDNTTDSFFFRRKLGAEEKITEQKTADPLVNEAVGQHRNGGSPNMGSADRLVSSTAVQSPEVMEVAESCSQRFSQSNSTTATVSDQQTCIPTVQDRVCTWSLVDSTTHTDPQGFCEQATNEIVNASLTSVEFEPPQTTQCNSAEIRPEKANHRILPIYSQISTSQGIKCKKKSGALECW